MYEQKCDMVNVTVATIQIFKLHVAKLPKVTGERAVHG